MYSFIKLLHLAAAIVWLGGMTFMLFALRPALMAQLDAGARAQFVLQVWKRFFAMVAVCVLVLLFSGLYFFAVLPKGAHGSLPLGWTLMLLIGVVMSLIFGHIYFAGFRGFQRALAAADPAAAAARAKHIHLLVLTNFMLGWLALAVIKLF